MSTIEQAAKRLAQLRRSGVEVDSGTGIHDTTGAPEAPLSDPLPLRVAKELEARTPAAAPEQRSSEETLAGGTGAPATAPGAVQGSQAPWVEAAVTAHPIPSRTRVEIDLARLSANGFITPQAPRSRLAEEFRVIKRPLLTNVRGRTAAPVMHANRIMVSSALPGEGKTFVSLNLAISLALDLDTHVLLVDADASRPAILDRLGLPPSKGLLDLLADPDLPLDSVVLSTNVDRLSILPAGTPHGQATELLGSDAMSRLVDRLASSGQRLLVLFDTPPLLSASEARVLAAHMGQVVVVIAADDTPQGTVAEALATVENCPVVLTLLNRVSASDRGHYYGSYSAHAHP